MAALFLLVGGLGMVAALLVLHFRVLDLEAALREHGILSEGVRELISPPRDHRAGPAPRRVSDPDNPTGSLPDQPPTGRPRYRGAGPKP